MKLYNKKKIFWIDDKLAKKLKDAAKKYNVKESFIIRDAIRVALENEK